MSGPRDVSELPSKGPEDLVGITMGYSMLKPFGPLPTHELQLRGDPRSRPVAKAHLNASTRQISGFSVRRQLLKGHGAALSLRHLRPRGAKSIQ